MGKYILIWVWGAVTIAFWFLSFNRFGIADNPQPNLFILLAASSTIVAVFASTCGVADEE